MSDTWMKLNKKQTSKNIRIIEDDWDRVETKNEVCFLCYASNCELYGLYGTYNSFGSFKGVCKDCLKKLNTLQKGGDVL